MPMSPPAREPALAAALLTACALLAGAAEPVLLADGLRGASALAATPNDAGGLRVLVAESEAQRLTEIVLLGEALLSRDDVGSLPDAGVTGLKLVGERCLVLTDAGVTSVSLEEWLDEPKAPAGEAVAGPPVSNSRWLFAPGEDALLRGRLALGRVTRLRRIDRPDGAPLAIALSPEGYLVSIVSKEEAHRIVFHDPERPEREGAGYPLDGLTTPRAIAYVGPPQGASLLAIDSEGGWRRVISRSTDTGTRAVAEPIDGPEGAVAFWPTPTGSLLVLTAERLSLWRPDL
ncbi:hypothetical protein MalM25_14040 [Planctomycetes bacterium MalM25]|nr:hypothetical protein MalM25_14040 [Planctomycetes bacterium MalM25]